MLMLQRIYSTLAASVLLVAATGCATHDRRDTAWDPKPGHSLIDVLDNWDGKAARVCGAHLRPEQRSPGMTDRC